MQPMRTTQDMRCKKMGDLCNYSNSQRLTFRCHVTVLLLLWGLESFWKTLETLVTDHYGSYVHWSSICWISPCHSPRLPPHLHPMCHILLLHHRHRKYHQRNHNRPRHCLSEICFVCVIYKREEGYIIFISYWRLEKTPDEQISHFHFSIKVVYEGCGRRDYITLSNWK